MSSRDEEPHRQRHVAESFGLDAERYDRARPRYPDAFLRPLAAGFPGPSVLDVGCGTGIVARDLQALGCRVVGVEPDPRMAAYARGTGVGVEIATIEEWDPDGRVFDAVVAGQTWHWVDPVAGADRVARVLRPGGVFSAFWNVEQPPENLAASFAATYRSAVPDSIHARRWETRDPDPYAALRARTIDGLRTAGGFDEPVEDSVARTYTCTRDRWLDQVPTQGGHAELDDQTLAAVLAGIGAAVDAAGGAFTMHCTTTSVTARRR